MPKQQSKSADSATMLGAVLKRWRITSERDLRSVAKEIGIGAATLMRIEQGQMFDVETWLKIQAWLFKGKQ